MKEMFLAYFPRVASAIIHFPCYIFLCKYCFINRRIWLCYNVNFQSVIFYIDIIFFSFIIITFFLSIIVVSSGAVGKNGMFTECCMYQMNVCHYTPIVVYTFIDSTLYYIVHL